MADIEQIFRILDIRSIHVHLKADRLTGKSAHGPMPADMVDFVKHFKPQITSELVERERLAETVTNVLALTESEQQQWAKEVNAAPRDDEHYDHDHRALRQVAAIRQAARSAAELERAA